MTNPFGSPPPAPPTPPVADDSGEAGAIPTLRTRVLARLFDELVLALPRFALTLPFLRLEPGGGFTSKSPSWAVAVSMVMIPFVYDFVSVALMGATPGKALVGIKVRSAVDGGRIAAYQAGLRAIIPVVGVALALAIPVPALSGLLSLSTPLIYASVIFDARRRGLHDKAAGTIVVTGENALDLRSRAERRPGYVTGRDQPSM